MILWWMWISPPVTSAPECGGVTSIPHAKELGCNKIALGHQFDDVIETILMGILCGGQINTMMPKLHSTNFSGMKLIRPLYFVKEEDILAWRDSNHLHFLQCACRFTKQIAKERAAAGEAVNGGDIVHTSKRQEMKELIARLRKNSPFIDANIMKSVKISIWMPVWAMFRRVCGTIFWKLIESYI